MRFVKPVNQRYHLANGNDWIELKKELTIGEDKRYRTRGLKAMSGVGGDGEGKDIKVDVEWDVLPFSRVEAYLVEWSDTRDVSRKAIEALATEDFEEIDNIVLKHIELMAEEKKLKNGTESAAATSP